MRGRKGALSQGDAPRKARTGLAPGQTYYLKLTVPDAHPWGLATYSLVADFTRDTSLLPPQAGDVLNTAAPQQLYALYVAGAIIAG